MIPGITHSGRAAVAALVLFLSVFLSSCIYNISLTEPKGPLKEFTVGGEGKDKILFLDISGIITDKTEKRFAFSEGERLVSRVREELDKAAKDADVKALIVRIDSIGGDVTTTDVLYNEITVFRKKKNVPVVALLSSIAASGGYYIALAADSIVAHPTTVTGSIGVIAYRVNASGLMQKVGLTDETVKSGELKDMGSPLRPSTEKERKVIQGIVDGLFTRFKTLVSERRGLKDDRLKAVIDGRVFTADEAVGNGLVDTVGYADDAVADAKSRAGLKDASIIVYSRPGSFRPNVYSATAAAPLSLDISMFNTSVFGLDEAGSGFKFLYMWSPGE